MQSTLTLEEIIVISRNRWTVQILAYLASHKGARFVELLRHFELPKDSLVRTLELAVAANWILKNPGYGHPLRPEYILTEEGLRLARAAEAVFAAQNKIELRAVVLTRWGLPLLRVIDQGDHRFNAISRALPSVSPRALSQGLRTLTDVKLVTRLLIDEYPPTSQYLLTDNGIVLARAA